MLLTYHDENRQGTADRPANEIEITPEMIEAGQDAVWSTPGAMEAAGLFSSEDLVCRVYSAMRAADHEGRAP